MVVFNCNRESPGSINMQAKQSTICTHPLESVTKNCSPLNEWILPLDSIHVLSEMSLGGTDYPKSYSKYSEASLRVADKLERRYPILCSCGAPSRVLKGKKRLFCSRRAHWSTIGDYSTTLNFDVLPLVEINHVTP